MAQRRVLLASPVQPIAGCSPNVYTWDKRPSPLRVSMSFLDHPGLSFLAANAPVEILPYPDLDRFRRALRTPPDILGLSFYLNETNVALEMADMARAAGVPEVWAGNYGAYSPDVESRFDRVFHGWSERTLCEALQVAPAPVFVHPEMYGAIGCSLFPRALFAGQLFTSRGCPFTCSFCQTPDFYGKPQPVPLDVLERVIAAYARRGVRGINILDENFGTFPKHSMDVVEILHRYGMRWIALTRVDTLTRNLEAWCEKGLFGAHLGVESLNAASLDGASKRVHAGANVALLRELSRRNLFVQSFYILGFPEDTPEGIRRDIELLATLDVDVVQVQVLTPYPRTAQRREIEAAYGIHDFNWAHYNSRHLVWNHPHISREDMYDLRTWAHARLLTRRRSLRTLQKFAWYFGQRRPNTDGVRELLNGFSASGRALHRQYGSHLRASRQWARHGWPAYEEQPLAHPPLDPTRAARVSSHA